MTMEAGATALLESFRLDCDGARSRTSTVLEQDHFYSDFLLSQTTVSTNFNHLEDEARHSLDRRECSYTWYAALVTFIYHECSTERLGSNFHHMLNLLKVLIAHFAH